MTVFFSINCDDLNFFACKNDKTLKISNTDDSNQLFVKIIIVVSSSNRQLQISNILIQSWKCFNFLNFAHH